MASSAFTSHLLALLQDPEDLLDAARFLPPGSLSTSPRQEEALNRAVIVTAVSAWEAYIEELVREAIESLRPAAPPMGLWPLHDAATRKQLRRFNTPESENVRRLLVDALGLPDIHTSWTWQNCTSNQARDRLAEVIKIRHEIAHGVNPRPTVISHYASEIPDYFRDLGRCTDRAVRSHLVNTLGVANPWPP